MGLAADDGIIAAVSAKSATAITYIAAFVSAVSGWLGSIDWVSTSGVCVAVVTAIANGYYKRQRNKREVEAAQLHEDLERQRAADEHEFQAREDKRHELESQARIALMQHQMHTEEE